MLRHLEIVLSLLLLACDTGAASDRGDDGRDRGADLGDGDGDADASAQPVSSLDAGPAGDAGSPREDDAAAAADDEDGGVDAVMGGCGAGECDLLDPLGCGVDEGCVWLLDAWGAPASMCLAVGTGLDGEACDDALDCAPGLDCTALDGSGTCRRYCCDLNDTAGCPAGQFCRVLLADEGGASGDGPVALCDGCDRCTPAATDECPSEQGCYPLPGGAECTACLPGGSVPAGEPCEAANDCEPGAGCFAVEGGERRCEAFCVLDGAKCESGNCRQVEGTTLPEGVGLCL